MRRLFSWDVQFTAFLRRCERSMALPGMDLERSTVEPNKGKCCFVLENATLPLERRTAVDVAGLLESRYRVCEGKWPPAGTRTGAREERERA